MFKFDADNTFCINLDRRQDRWEKMQARFLSANLEVTRWKASTPEDVVDVIQGSSTQQACAQSHIRIWRHIVENNLEYALVMEDDVTFDKEWRKKIEEFEKLNLLFNLILLNTDHYYGVNVWNNTQGDSWLTGAYIISHSCARILLEIGKRNECFLPSDHMLITFQRMFNNRGCYSYFPYLAIQTSLESDIAGSLPEMSFTKVVKELETHNYSLSNYI